MINHTVSVKTNHFSTYLPVDSEEWYECWKESVLYELDSTTHKRASCCDVVFVIDCANNMNREIAEVKKSIENFADAMYVNDRVGCIKCTNGKNNNGIIFNDKLVRKTDIMSEVNDLKPSGKTNVEKGLEAAIKLINKNQGNTVVRNKMIIFFTNGQTDIDKRIDTSAKKVI